jgi:cytochrome c oxidase cbb3-type subunit 2
MALDIHTSHRTFLALTGGIYLVLVVLVAIVPAVQMDRAHPPGDPGHSPEEARGFEVYKSEGCWYCHTQQIRGDERLPTDAEGRHPVLRADRRFGLDSPTTAKTYQSASPPLLGTQRTGPDLTAIGTRQPDRQWHYWHLYAPRALTPDSNMPPLPWLFYVDTAKVSEADEEVAALEALGLPKDRKLFATADARALVDYLLSLTRPEVTR